MRGPVNGQTVSTADTDGRSLKQLSTTFVGHLQERKKNGDCRLEYIRGRPVSLALASSTSGGGFDSRAAVSDHPFVANENKDRLPIWSTWFITRWLRVRVPPARLAIRLGRSSIGRAP